MPIGLLGILKAGGAFVPLDPAHPPERLAFMLKDADVDALVSHTALRDQLPRHAHAAPIVWLDADWPAIGRHPPIAPFTAIQPENLAYVIYTSGSTGVPKGVAVTHRGLPNLAAVEIDCFALTPAARVLQFASLSFDAAIWEIVSGLASGATLVLTGSDRVGDALANVIRTQNVTHATLPPAVLPNLSSDLPLQTLVVAGETCPPELVLRWSAGRQMINAYGPTETTVCATMSGPLSGASIPPIGRPIWNTRVYVLDERLEPVPAGVASELVHFRHRAGARLSARRAHGGTLRCQSVWTGRQPACTALAILSVGGLTVVLSFWVVETSRSSFAVSGSSVERSRRRCCGTRR